MSTFSDLKEEIERGLSGKNNSIPIGLPRLSRYIGIRKRIYTTIVSGTGMGKSAMLHNCYILNPYDWMISKNNKDGVKLKTILFAMERSKVYTTSKWLSRKIFLDHGILIPVGKMLGWWTEKMSLEEHDYVLAYEDYFDEMIEGGHVTIIEGPQNPTGIYKYVKHYAEAHGKIEEIDEFKKVYIADNPDEVVQVALDHFGLLKLESKINSKKEAIDKASEYLQWFRDFLSYSCIGISQINRDIANPTLLKMGDVEPSLESIKESGRPAEDADVVVTLFDPLRYDLQKTLQTDKLGYEPYKMENPQTGARHYRRLKILKNSYGESDLAGGLAFQGALGLFVELKRAKDMTDRDYQDIIRNTYFLSQP